MPRLRTMFTLPIVASLAMVGIGCESEGEGSDGAVRVGNDGSSEARAADDAPADEVTQEAVRAHEPGRVIPRPASDYLAGALLSFSKELPAALYEARTSLWDLERAFPDFGETPHDEDLVVYYAIGEFTREGRPHTDPLGNDTLRRTLIVGTNPDTGEASLMYATVEDWSDQLAAFFTEREVVTLDPDTYAERGVSVLETAAPPLLPSAGPLADR